MCRFELAGMYRGRTEGKGLSELGNAVEDDDAW
jgi:hypothetical protein